MGVGYFGKLWISNTTNWSDLLNYCLPSMFLGAFACATLVSSLHLDGSCTDNSDFIMLGQIRLNYITQHASKGLQLFLAGRASEWMYLCAIDECAHYWKVRALSMSACAIEKCVRYWQVHVLLKSACAYQTCVRYYLDNIYQQTCLFRVGWEMLGREEQKRHKALTSGHF